jgi:hypothetical protein
VDVDFYMKNDDGKLTCCDRLPTRGMCGNRELPSNFLLNCQGPESPVPNKFERSYKCGPQFSRSCC